MKLAVLCPCPAPTLLLLFLLEGPEAAENNPCAVQKGIGLFRGKKPLAGHDILGLGWGLSGDTLRGDVQPTLGGVDVSWVPGGGAGPEQGQEGAPTARVLHTPSGWRGSWAEPPAGSRGAARGEASLP